MTDAAKPATDNTPRVESATPANPTKLRVVITGRASAAGRTPTLVRLDDALLKELRELADGPIYMLCDIALRKYIAELKARPPEQGLEVIRL